jgi:hypothetical protein
MTLKMVALNLAAWLPQLSTICGSKAMSKKPEPGNELPRATPPSPPQVSPKRGAFPTPRSEIEKATPYVPDIPSPRDDPTTEPDPSKIGVEKKNG